jgi:hypothetical protein
MPLLRSAYVIEHLLAAHGKHGKQAAVEGEADARLHHRAHLGYVHSKYSHSKYSANVSIAPTLATCTASSCASVTRLS